MKCFHFFKKKQDHQIAKSAPELNNDRRTAKTATNRPSKSTGSLPSRTIPDIYRDKEPNLRVFSFSELRQATNNFDRLLKIGEGGFGSVYKGTITDLHGGNEPLPVAIKKLNKHGFQGHKEWLAEVQFLGIVDHPNLVKLLGYCSVDGERGIQLLLVYEYMSNMSLDDHMFGRFLQRQTLSWISRLQIIHGAAQGLNYLHQGLEIQVIYRDFKSSNVLLDANMNPKLSDFGLAREGPAADRSHVSTAPVGTYGYAAPEYVETGHLTAKSDMWSFGVVLYEILTGKRVLERSRPTSEQKLLDWVKQFPVNSKKFSRMIDPRLRNDYSISAAQKIAKLAESCLNKNPKDRPTMSEVVEILGQVIQESESLYC